jgi:hypothetical protein
MKKAILILALVLIPSCGLVGGRDARDIEFVEHGLKVLEIYDANVRVIQYPITPRIGWFNVLYGGTERDPKFNKSYTISIYGYKLNRSHFKKTLAHELVHVWQLHTGKLDHNDDYTIIVWEGDTISAKDTPYDKRPWEVEAFAKADSLAKVIDYEVAKTRFAQDKKRLERIQKRFKKAVGLD